MKIIALASRVCYVQPPQNLITPQIISNEATPMGDEQKKWQQQFLNNSGGTREVFRFGCVFAIWLGIGIGLTLWSNNGGYMLICIGGFFTFAFLSATWQPAYSLIRKIYGNENLPRKILPHKLTWWNYILLIFWFVVSIAIVLKGFQLLFQ